MKTDIGLAFLHRGEWGSRLTVEFGSADGGHGTYDIPTHGKDQATIRAEVEAVKVFHAAKMQRHDALAAIRGQVVMAGWTLTDCYVERRGTDARLHLIARSSTGEIAEFEAHAATAGLLPDNAAAIAGLVAKINADTAAKKAAHDAATAAVAGGV